MPNDHHSCIDPLCKTKGMTHWLRMEAQVREMIALWDKGVVSGDVAMNNINTIIAQETGRGSSAPVNGSY